MFYEATIYIAYKRKKRANEDHELDADDDGESDSMDDDDDDNMMLTLTTTNLFYGGAWNTQTGRVCDFIRFITQIIKSSKEIMKSMCICTDFIIAKGFENN